MEAGKGMILAFIGFEASAPLGEEAKHPRRPIPRAVVFCLTEKRASFHPVLHLVFPLAGIA